MHKSNTITAFAVDKIEGLFEFFKLIQEGTSPPTRPSPQVTGSHKHKKNTSWLETS